jgi:ABC-type long-subunit fatty acid transport system fused permease/ATPase subunit
LIGNREASAELRHYDELLDFDQTIVTFYLIHKRLNIFVKKIEGKSLRPID